MSLDKDQLPIITSLYLGHLVPLNTRGPLDLYLIAVRYPFFRNLTIGDIQVFDGTLNDLSHFESLLVRGFTSDIQTYFYISIEARTVFETLVNP